MCISLFVCSWFETNKREINIRDMNNKNHPNSKHTTTFNLSKSSWNILQMFPFLFLLFCMNYELFDFIQLLFMKHVVITPHFSRQSTQNRNNEREKLPQKKPKTSFVILFMNIFLICFFFVWVFDGIVLLQTPYHDFLSRNDLFQPNVSVLCAVTWLK